MMRLIRQKLSIISVFALTLTLLITIPFQPIFAALVSTEAALHVLRANESRENLKKLISREDVQKMLIYRGIDPAEAKARVNSLTDSEAIVLAEEIDKLPAAGNAIGVIVGAALIVFLVLLLTDILGYTDVFPFVKAKK
jgi:hypothetical protein